MQKLEKFLSLQTEICFLLFIEDFVFLFLFESQLNNVG